MLLSNTLLSNVALRGNDKKPPLFLPPFPCVSDPLTPPQLLVLEPVSFGSCCRGARFVSRTPFGGWCLAAFCEQTSSYELWTFQVNLNGVSMLQISNIHPFLNALFCFPSCALPSWFIDFPPTHSFAIREERERQAATGVAGEDLSEPELGFGHQE